MTSSFLIALPGSLPPETGTRRIKWTYTFDGEPCLAVFERGPHGDRLIELLPDPDFNLTPADLSPRKDACDGRR